MDKYLEVLPMEFTADTAGAIAETKTTVAVTVVSGVLSVYNNLVSVTDSMER